MKSSIAKIVITLLVFALGVSAAHATQITGDFSLSSTAGQSFVPVNGATGATATIGTATGLDFTTIISGGVPQKTPGVPGQFTINTATGNFAPLIGTVGAMKDFTFAGLGSPSYPNAPIAAFET